MLRSDDPGSEPKSSAIGPRLIPSVRMRRHSVRMRRFPTGTSGGRVVDDRRVVWQLLQVTVGKSTCMVHHRAGADLIYLLISTKEVLK